MISIMLIATLGVRPRQIGLMSGISKHEERVR